MCCTAICGAVCHFVYNRTMEIRQLNKADQTNILKCLQEIKTQGYDLSVLEYLEDESLLEQDLEHEVLVGACGFGLAGLFRGKRKPGREHSAHITAYVSPNYQGRELATQMTALGLKLLKEKAVKVIHAYVYSNNEASIHSMLKQGFILSGRVPMHHFEDDEIVDDLIFVKYL